MYSFVTVEKDQQEGGRRTIHLDKVATGGADQRQQEHITDINHQGMRVVNPLVTYTGTGTCVMCMYLVTAVPKLPFWSTFYKMSCAQNVKKIKRTKL